MEAKWKVQSGPPGQIPPLLTTVKWLLIAKTCWKCFMLHTGAFQDVSARFFNLKSHRSSCTARYSRYTLPCTAIGDPTFLQTLQARSCRPAKGGGSRKHPLGIPHTPLVKVNLHLTSPKHRQKPICLISQTIFTPPLHTSALRFH